MKRKGRDKNPLFRRCIIVVSGVRRTIGPLLMQTNSATAKCHNEGRYRGSRGQFRPTRTTQGRPLSVPQTTGIGSSRSFLGVRGAPSL